MFTINKKNTVMHRNTKIHENFLCTSRVLTFKQTIMPYKNIMQHNNWNLDVFSPVDVSSWSCPNMIFHSIEHVKTEKKMKTWFLKLIIKLMI